MPRYRLLSGTHRLTDGTKVEAGGELTLTAEEAGRLNHERLKLLDDTDANAAATSESAATETADTADATPATADDDAGDADGDAAADAELTSEASGDLPSEYSRLQQMAVAYEGEEVDGRATKHEMVAVFSELSETEIADLKLKAGL